MTDSDSEVAFESADEGEEQHHLLPAQMVPGEPHHTGLEPKMEELKIEGTRGDDGVQEHKPSSPPTKPKAQRPSRVPLRLEKKIQEKNRSSVQQEADRLNKLKSSPAPSASPSLIMEDAKPAEISGGWGGWGSWGSMLSTAASTVSTISSQVSNSIETVMETFEATLGVPSAEELAKQLNASSTDVFFPPEGEVPEEEALQTEELPQELQKRLEPALLQGVSAFTKAIESTGSKVIQGSLDTLELLGQKTINIITEGDPGLRKKRSLLTGDSGALLSQALKEARERSDAEVLLPPSLEQEASYITLLENFHGLAHLEALEALSQVARAAHLLNGPGDNLCGELNFVDDLPLDNEEDHNFEAAIQEHVSELRIPFSAKKLLNTHKRVRTWLAKNQEDLDSQNSSCSSKAMYQKGINSLAELTAHSLEHWHRLAEHLSGPGSVEEDAALWKDNLTQLARTLCHELGLVSATLSRQLNSCRKADDDTDGLITNLYMETSSSINYLQDAYNLVLPILHC